VVRVEEGQQEEGEVIAEKGLGEEGKPTRPRSGPVCGYVEEWGKQPCHGTDSGEGGRGTAGGGRGYSRERFG